MFSNVSPALRLRWLPKDVGLVGKQAPPKALVDQEQPGREDVPLLQVALCVGPLFAIQSLAAFNQLVTQGQVRLYDEGQSMSVEVKGS